MNITQKTVEYIRHLRSYQLVNDLVHWKQLRGYSEKFHQYGVRRQIWRGMSFSDIANPDKENLPWLDKEISDKDISSHPQFCRFSSGIQSQLLAWRTNGYMILPGFFEADRIDELEKSIEGCMNEKERAAYRTDRYQDLWTKNAQADSFFRDPELTRLLSFVLGREAVPFQSLNFYKGTEQSAHSDSIHFTTEPFGYMIAVWIALEDITEGSGELIYYPGSHRLPFITNQDYDHGNTWWKIHKYHYQRYEKKIAEMVKGKNLQTLKFSAKKGDVLVWHANLLHGGSKITVPEASRKSMVIHFYGKDALCYHERVGRLAILSRLKKRLTC